MPAKTNAQRQAALKARRQAAGLVPVTNLWVHPEDVQPIREHAGKLAKRRKRTTPAPTSAPELGTDDIRQNAIRHFTELPRPGTLARDLTDRDKVALALAAGLPTETLMDGTMLTVRVTVPFGIADRGDGGYVVATPSKTHRAAPTSGADLV
jgi:hypothetical protein